MAEKTNGSCRLAEYLEKLPEREISRRSLLKSGALLGGSAVLMSQLEATSMLARSAEAAGRVAGGYPLSKAENTIYSVCLQCHTACPIKVKVLNGIAVKVDGNPYSENMIPNLDYSAPLSKGAKIDAKVCPKGQSGIQSLYDPYRIVKVLKRNGPRGSNKWTVIPFDQAVDEIVNGGKLFASIGEQRHVPGLKEIYGLRDAKLSARMAKDATAVAKGKMQVADFKSKYRAHLDVLIDPDHPDLGPKNNQLLTMWGRIEHGRIELGKRFMYGSFGSHNLIEHTCICEQSHHIAYKESTKQYKGGKWKKGKTHMKPDAFNAEFIVYFGTGFVEANFGPPAMCEKVTEGLASGRLKVAVVDPRMSKSAAKAWKWLPIQPSTDAALALAMIRWMIEHKRYDARYLANANKAAAKASGETTWSNAAHLVKIEKDGPGALLRASDVGVGGKDAFVVVREGNAVSVKVGDGKNAVTGDLDFSGEINGVKVKTAFRLLKEEAFSRGLAEWSAICGIPVKDIEEVARELTSHGKKAAVEFYRGPVQHTNGFYNARALIALNILLGNADHKGGMSVGGSHWHEFGGKSKEQFSVKKKKMHPNMLTAFGHKITREGSHYEQSTLFRGYPAKRPWLPFTSNVYQEALPSAADGYPYPIKALWLHMGSPGYASPAAHTALKILADVEKIPLFFSTDIVLGESTMYADYVFPDTAIWERFGNPHASPDVPLRASKFRQPTVTPLTEVVTVFGEKMHCSYEAVLLAIAERLKLSGFGTDGFGRGWGLTRPEDWFLKLAANMAVGDKKGDSVPAASFDEMKLFVKARRHLKPTVFSARRWEKAVGSDKWKRTVTVLNRGGRWEKWADEVTNGKGMLVHKFKKQLNLYVERVAVAKQSLTGKRFSGVPIYEPPKDAAGNLAVDRNMPLQLITYKDILGGQSRTLPGNYWLSSILPENYLLINVGTAKKLGFEDGDKARLISATNHDGKWHLPNRGAVDMVGKIKAVEGMAPGVVAVSWHFGHWGYGAADSVIDGRTIKGDKRRTTGLCPNAAMKVDPVLKNACMTDPIGGSSSYYDTRVTLMKA
ncbi:MAG: molybdopterin-dependent oxidoreductase [Candidatus Methylomirabilales bacterium]